MSTVPSPYPRDGATTWYGLVLDRVSKGRAVVFAITEEGEFRGVIGVNDIDREISRAHLDYWVAAPYQGRGIATEAVALAMDHARGELQLQWLLSTCLTVHHASARVLERNGFVECARVIASQEKFAGNELRRFRVRLDAPHWRCPAEDSS